MLTVLKYPIYARLFSAQVIALLGTGLLTVALGLLAYDIAKDSAGAVLGTALAIKMVAYVALSPVANTFAERLPRKAVLIGADLIRAGTAVFLPFIDAVWQIYALIFVLQTASASFTPAFQATIPDVLKTEADYTRALSLSRLAYDLENMISPALAGLLLTVMSYHWLFGGTVVGFLISALLVLGTALPARAEDKVRRPFRERLTRGIRIYLATPRLKGLLALNVAAASAGAFVIVNTVVIVRSAYGMNETAVAIALAAFGGGSMLAALSLPSLLDRLDDRRVMATSAAFLSAIALGSGLYFSAVGYPFWQRFLAIWLLIGALYSAILTPAGRLLRISAHEEDRPAIFTAQFALSHACWLLTYPLAGWLGETTGMGTALLVLSALSIAGTVASLKLWPKGDPRIVAHEHPDLPSDHPHLKQFHTVRKRHRHRFIIDDEHRAWPTQG
jgi:MFS family permease